MLDYENDVIELDEESEKLQEQLALEWKEETELAIEQDEHPLEPETDELPEKKKLKRELKAEALLRLENGAVSCVVLPVQQAGCYQKKH